jgi:predicted TIM-barrel fold metal-dependent hydrolase
MAPYRIIDPDAHAIEPKNLWEKWLPRAYQDKAPKLVKDAEGGDAWLFKEGTAPEPIGLVTTPGQRYEEFRWLGYTYEDIRPSCWDGKERLKDMDFDGVDAEVLYPPQRTMMYFMTFEDEGIHLGGVRAYNDWLMQEFCAPNPDRLIGLAQIPNLGVEAAVAELRRAKGEGFRSAIISTWPSGGDWVSEADDPFWAAAEEMGMPVSVHLNIQRRTKPTVVRAADDSIEKTFMRAPGTGGTEVAGVISQMIVAGVYDRFPGLKMVATETGVGWIPFFLEQMDDRYWRNRTWAKVNLELVPSEYFRRNWLATFIRDAVGVQIRHMVGVDNMMWSTDFPHHGNDWPYSRRVIDEQFVGVPRAERERIVCENARDLYGLPAAYDRSGVGAPVLQAAAR